MEERRIIKTARFPQLSWLKTGSGPAFILLHGFPESGALWREVWPALAKSFTVIIPDLPGSGESNWESEHISMEDMAASVKEIMDNEGIGTAIMAGHSMGGYAALAFAELYPRSLIGLSMVHSGAAADTDEKKENRRKAIEVVKKGGRETFIRQMIPGLFAESTKGSQPGIINDEILRGLKLKTQAIVAFYNAMINRPDRISILNNAAFPVQWIIGKHDNVLPFEKLMQQTMLAGVNFVSVYGDAAHMSMLEAPQKLAGDMETFGKYCLAKTGR